MTSVTDDEAQPRVVFLCSSELLHSKGGAYAQYLLHSRARLVMSTDMLDQLDLLHKAGKVSAQQPNDQARKPPFSAFIVEGSRNVLWGPLCAPLNEENTVERRKIADVQALKHLVSTGDLTNGQRVVILSLGTEYEGIAQLLVELDQSIDISVLKLPSSDPSSLFLQFLSLHASLPPLCARPRILQVQETLEDLEDAISEVGLHAFVDTGHLPPTQGVDGKKALWGVYRAGTVPKPVQVAILPVVIWELSRVSATHKPAKATPKRRVHKAVPASGPSAPSPGQSMSSLWPTKGSALLEQGVIIAGASDDSASEPPVHVVPDAAIAYDLHRFTQQLQGQSTEGGREENAVAAITGDRYMFVRYLQVAANSPEVPVVPLWVGKEKQGGIAQWRSPLKSQKQGDEDARSNAWARFIATAVVAHLVSQSP